MYFRIDHPIFNQEIDYLIDPISNEYEKYQEIELLDRSDRNIIL